MITIINNSCKIDRRRISFASFIVITLIFELLAGILSYSDYSKGEAYSGLYTYLFNIMLIPALIGLLRGIVENTSQRLLTDKKGARAILFALLKLFLTLLIHSFVCQLIYEAAYCLAVNAVFTISIYESLVIFRYAIGIGLAAFILTSALSLLIPTKKEN